MQQKNIVIIASSTGGIKTLERLFSDIPLLDASIIIVQHIRDTYPSMLAEVLNKKTEMDVSKAKDGKFLKTGHVYVVPGGVHLKLTHNRLMHLFKGKKINYVRPAADVTMMSLKKKEGYNFVGIVLTGMGEDGVEGISHIKRIGGITIAQDEITSVMYGMPKAAVNTGCIDLVLTPEEIKETLIRFFGVDKNSVLKKE